MTVFAHVAHAVAPAPRRVDSTRTEQARMRTMQRKQARTVARTAAPLDLDALRAELCVGVAR